MALHNYSSNGVSCIVGAHIVNGYADGAFVTVTRASNAYLKYVGTDGQVTRAQNPDKSGTITFMLAASSPSNDVFMGLATADQQSNSGNISIQIRDLNGTSLISCLNAWVQKVPDIEFAREVSTRTWVFESDDVEMFVGGNVLAKPQPTVAA